MAVKKKEKEGMKGIKMWKCKKKKTNVERRKKLGNRTSGEVKIKETKHKKETKSNEEMAASDTTEKKIIKYAHKTDGKVKRGKR